MTDGFVEAYAKSTGLKQLIPQHWLKDPVLGRNFEITPSAKARAGEDGPADEQPLGEPAETWTRKQLDEHAAALGVDSAAMANKAEVLAAINSVGVTTAGDVPDPVQDGDNPYPDGTPPSDESPAAGENQE